MTWMQTVGGRPMSLLEPDPCQVDLGDICTALARLPRFTGATRFPYPVAMHCIHVAKLAGATAPHDPATYLWGLAHDFHEAFTNDLSSPFQQAIEALLPADAASPIKIIQRSLDHAIALRFGICWDDIERVRPAVKHADMVALATEKHQLMENAPAGWNWGAMPEPDVVRLCPVSEDECATQLRIHFEWALRRYRAFQRDHANG